MTHPVALSISPVLSLRALCLGVGLTLLPGLAGCGPKGGSAPVTSPGLALPAGLTYAQPVVVLTSGTAMKADLAYSIGGAVASYAVTPALPAGLVLNRSTGAISGTPTALSPRTIYLVTASNALGSTTTYLAVTVNEDPPDNLSYAQPALTLTFGQAMVADTPSSTGGEVAFYAVSPSLPQGLTFDRTTGVIAGTPTEVSAALSCTVTATNDFGSTTAQVTLTVKDVAPASLSYAQPTVTLITGQAMAADTPSGSGGAVSSYSVSPALPSGLALDGTTGVLAGTPTVAIANTPFTITAANGAGSATAQVVITVYAAARTSFTSLALLAGNLGGPGYLDGTGANARFNAPQGVALDTGGNLYVADSGNNSLRKVSPGGVVTTLAAQTPFSNPAGVVVDSGGNVYVADAGSATIRQVTPAGTVSTLAGTLGNVGNTDGTGSTASFGQPSGVALDAKGNLYVADAQNHNIRKVTPGGVVTTLAGSGAPGSADGTGTSASFHGPTGVAVDGYGNVYVADQGNHALRMVTSGGVVTTLAGTAGAQGFVNGTGGAARFNLPTGVGVDGLGNIYVADAGNAVIRRVTTGGEVTTLAGTGTRGGADGAGTVASFVHPGAVVVAGTGSLYVTDAGNHTLRAITAAPALWVSTLAGLAGTAASVDGLGAAAGFLEPRNVAADSAGNLYVAEYGGHTLRLITPSGRVTTLAGTPGTVGSAGGTGTAASFDAPYGVAVDGAGTIYVSDMGNHTIRQVTAAGEVTTLAGTAGTQGSADGQGPAASFFHPAGVAVDAAGNVYVADAMNYTIRKITPQGAVTTLAGTAGVSGTADGTGPDASFQLPKGLAVDPGGTVYVADAGAGTIRKISPAGVVTTLAGTPGTKGSADGLGAAASFNGPTSLAVDGRGNVYVADTGNSTLRMVTPDGNVGTVVGAPGMAGTVPGPLPALIDSPYGVAVHPVTGALVIVSMGAVGLVQ